MLRKDYFKFCSCLILGSIISYIVAPILCIWTTYTYLNVSMVKNSDYYVHICIWFAIFFILLFIKSILLVNANKVYNNTGYGVNFTFSGIDVLDARADKLNLTDEERDLFKKYKHRADKLHKLSLSSFLDKLSDCLLHSGLIFLGATLLFVFLYLLTSLSMMLSIALELLKLGIAVLLDVLCWGT